MIFAMDPDKGIVPQFPITVLDRHGNKVEKKIVEVDTDTGRIVAYRYPYEIDSKGDVITDESFVDAPLSVIPTRQYEERILSEGVTEPTIVEPNHAKTIDSANLSACAG